MLDPITLEIVCQYRFKDFTGGFTNAEVFGEINYETSIQKAEVLCLAGTDNKIRFINIRNIKNHKRKKEEFVEGNHQTAEIVIESKD